MVRSKLAWLGAFALAAVSLQAQSFYVNGLTGQDNPASGSSALSPWKTIGYALAKIPQMGGNPTLWVAGNQVYSTTTNGEAFPITPAFDVWIEGSFVGGVMPVIRPPANATAMLFNPAVAYNRNQVTLRYLVFDGGVVGVHMGGNPGVRHRPRFQDCTFQNQTTASVEIANNGTAICDPAFFQNTFRDAPRAIVVTAAYRDLVNVPIIEENTFRNHSNASILVEDQSFANSTVGAQVRSNWFYTCARGVWIRNGQQSASDNSTINLCSFSDLTVCAIQIDLVRQADLAATVDQCSFLRCAQAVALSGAVGGGNSALTLTKNAVLGGSSAFSVSVAGSGALSVISQDNWIDGAKSGFTWESLAGSQSLIVSSIRDRALRCSTGVDVKGSGSNGIVNILSGIYSESTSTGVSVQGSMPVTLRSLTISNGLTGLNVAAGGARTIDHMVVAGNTTELNVPGAQAITHSCFQGTSWPGTGNLNNTNPQLVLPFYKLARTSPCIDKGSLVVSLPATDYEGDNRAAVSKVGGLPLPDLGADEYLQAGSVRRYGTRGFGLYNFFPEISSPNTTAKVAGTLQIDLNGAVQPAFSVPATGAVLSFGMRDDSGSYPFDLTPFGAPGCLLWNEAQSAIGVYAVNPLGKATAVIPIPAHVPLIGQTFTFQWWALLPGVNTLGVVTSDGLRVTLEQ